MMQEKQMPEVFFKPSRSTTITKNESNAVSASAPVRRKSLILDHLSRPHYNDCNTGSAAFVTSSIWGLQPKSTEGKLIIPQNTKWRAVHKSRKAAYRKKYEP